MAAAQEAVALRRELVALNRDAYLPVLASSVNNLAVRLAEAGRHAEALATAQETSAHYHDLARTDHDVFGPAAEQADDLVIALSHDTFNPVAEDRFRPGSSLHVSSQSRRPAAVPGISVVEPQTDTH